MKGFDPLKPILWICWVLFSIFMAGDAYYLSVYVSKNPALREIKGEVWAAWVQAVGSILAVLAAIWISNRQSARENVWRRESRRRKFFAEQAERLFSERARVQRFQSISLELHVLMTRISKNISELPPGGTIIHDAFMFNDLLSRMANIEREEEDIQRIGNLILMRNLLVGVHRTLLENHGTQMYFSESAIKSVKEWVSQSQELHDFFNKEIEKVSSRKIDPYVEID